MSAHADDDQIAVAAQSLQEPSSPDAGRVYSYQQKFTRCNKPNCSRCTNGPGHGPYWYAFWWEAGRTRTKYLGKSAPPEAVTDEVHVSAPAATHLPALRVATLGRFAVWSDDVRVPDTAWQRRKALALFKLLISTPGHRLIRDQALEELWPDVDSRAAETALRGATHGVRQALRLAGSGQVMGMHGDTISFAEGLPLRIDADEFATAGAEALAHRDVELCRAALALYGGDYLPEDLYEDWSIRRREALAELRTAVLIHQARLCSEEGDTAEARGLLSSVLAVDPAHEEAACRLMTLLAAIGERTESIRVFRRLSEALRDEYGLEPGEEVAVLARNLSAQQSAHNHRPPSVAVRRHTNLPFGLSTFVGRQDAQTSVRRMLRDGRLVTLSGPGGSGKTRLALRVAELALDTYPDGVWLCELAGLGRQAGLTQTSAEADPVAAAVASALGLVEDPGHRLEDSICAFLEPRHLLLILDNCEHLIDSVARLADAVMRRCPQVAILVTSQEALGVPGETTWAVPPLTLPDSTQHYTPESLHSFDAIRLFVERARAARPGFVLDTAAAPLVVDICTRLEGMPLAIELAAARLAFLSLDVLAARMNDRFRVLVGGSRVALPQHQTLRAMMDWSYRLLGTKEQALLRRLTLFSGGWTLAAAEGICSDPSLAPEAILDTLGGLVAKSLVSVRGRDAQERYGMLETVREYGRARLFDEDQEACFRERHLAWFAQHCEDTIATWGATDQAALLSRLDAEIENVRAALAWGSDQAGAATNALRLASALSRYWQTRGLVGEGRRWTARTLEAAPEAPKTLRATALNRCALLARLEGDAESAAQLLGASLDSFRELDDEEGIARVAGNLGLLRYDCGDDLGAVAALSECIALNRRHGKHPDVPFFQLNLGMVYTRLKRYAEAEAAFAEAHANWQAAGDQVGTSTTILNMAHLARDQQQFERAAGLYLSGLRISVAIGDRPLLSAGLEGISHVLLRRAGDARDKTRLKLCVQILACAAGLRESTGVAVHAANFPQYQADLKRLRAILGTKAFEAEWTRGWDAPVETLVVQLSGLQRK